MKITKYSALAAWLLLYALIAATSGCYIYDEDHRHHDRDEWRHHEDEERYEHGDWDHH